MPSLAHVPFRLASLPRCECVVPSGSPCVRIRKEGEGGRFSYVHTIRMLLPIAIPCAIYVLCCNQSIVPPSWLASDSAGSPVRPDKATSRSGEPPPPPPSPPLPPPQVQMWVWIPHTPTNTAEDDGGGCQAPDGDVIGYDART